MDSGASSDPVDLLVVGAGVVGLAHAVEARLRGLRVVVIDRDEHAVGASIRNFGHICTTAQSGPALDHALRSRDRWLELGVKASVPLLECGTLVVARSDAESAVLEEFAERRGSDQVILLDRAGVSRRLARHDPDVVAGALLPMDLRVDPRRAVAAIAAWLAEQDVDIRWRTSAIGWKRGALLTSRGVITARKTVVAVGHDVDHLFPEVADEVGLRRCALHMLRVAAPDDLRVEPAVLTGLSMLRYPGLAESSAAAQIREHYARSAPELLEVVMNLMFTQLGTGDLIIGDTHRYALTHDPFDDERHSDLVLREGARLLGVGGLTVRQRWRGVYADSDRTDFLIKQLDPDARVVSVTSGIGMTTAHGLAAAVLDDLL